jgi:two-component system response regulator HydG
VVALRVPPLRERPEDILILAQHFLEKFAVSMNRQVPDLTASAREMLETYPWPGNVRELENAIERAMVLSRGPRIDASDLPLQKEGPVLPASASLEEVEKVHIERVVNDSRWNLSRAARILDIDRSTLYAKLKRYGLMKHNTHNA